MSWWQTAKVGDRVVVIDGPLPLFGNRLVVGTVHTIKEIVWSDLASYQGCYVYIRITDDPSTINGKWSAMCFRPVDPLTKRMNELRGLLDPNRGPWGPRETVNELEKESV